MSARTVRQDLTATATATATANANVARAAGAEGPWASTGRAARELGLKRTAFDLAVHLGHIRTVPDEGGGGRRVGRAEIERLRARPGFPEALRESVRTVGTAQGAALMEVTKTRFTRLARLGLLVPVNFHLNRCRAVVWLYPAEELRRFAADTARAPLLTGRTPGTLRSQLVTGLDLRPRNWRSRHLGFLLRQAGDPWVRAAAVASLLDPLEISCVVKDPYERSHLNGHRPPRPFHGTPGSPAARLAEELMTAQDEDEIAWLRSDLARLVEEAREQRQAPRPAQDGHRPVLQAPHEPDGPHKARGRYGRSRGLLAHWFRRGW
ncbi:DUF6397 family protein [Streptomyces sp. NPDC005931]|uniref:DUF6397 family protein n=1 Tax=Streptomyces sp. NPDC005931 TaxID=3364737 RepID=UPI0036899A72